jgi:hypothetical protein
MRVFLTAGEPQAKPSGHRWQVPPALRPARLVKGRLTLPLELKGPANFIFDFLR